VAGIAAQVYVKDVHAPHLVIAGVLCAGQLFGCAPTHVAARRDAGRLGSVRIFSPDDEPTAFVFLFSDVDGWNAALDGAGRTLRDGGAAVVGVDLPAYLSGLAASDDGCHYVVAEIEALSGQLQHELGATRYRTPILAGIGAGGTLAYAALAQAPAATIAGAVSVDPAPVLGTRVPLCAGAPHRRMDGGFRYGSQRGLPGWWRVSAPALPSPMHGIVTAAAGMMVDADGTQTERLLAALDVDTDDTNAFRDLPVVPIEATNPGPLLAVIYSGDGGWRDLDKQIGEYLSDHGVSVVGIDSLRYFWSEKSPQEVASDLADLIEHFEDEWGTSKVLLVGYSFGAAILPFAYNRLPPARRADVVQVSLLGLEPWASFVIRLSAWIGSEPGAGAPRVRPEVARMPPALVQCFYGEDEEESLCRDSVFANAEVVGTTGGHHFDGDYDALATRILAGVSARLGSASDDAAQPARH